jgi:hypothetical protein
MHPCGTLEPSPAHDCLSRAPAGRSPPPTLRRAPPQPPPLDAAPSPHHCSTPLPPLRSTHCHGAQFFLPAPYSHPPKSHATPLVLPLCISSVADRRRATAVPESCEAPLPTAPFGELHLHHLLILGWPAPHFPLAPPVLQVFPPPP